MIELRNEEISGLFNGVLCFFNCILSLSFVLNLVSLMREGEAAIGGGKQAKGAAAADARNRRALGDIGNLVTVRGVDAKANRPITRSFCAQLLANAQAAAKAENNKVSHHNISLSFAAGFVVLFSGSLRYFLS